MPESTTLEPSDAVRPLFVGVDIGGTNVKIGLVDDLGRTIRAARIATDEPRGPEDALRRIAAAIRHELGAVSLDLSDVAAVGLGTPGTMDLPTGRILEPPNMPHWRYFPLRDRLAELCGLAVAFANDANAAAYGEFWVGSGRDHDSLIMLTLGTGVGGGVIENGQLINGLNSFGSECGHIIIDGNDDARLCTWGGGRGELEAYASASAVVARAEEALAAGAPSSLADRLAAGQELSALMVAQEAEAGDALSDKLVLETARYLGIGITTMVHMIDPGLVILGGAMNFGGAGSELGRRFLEAVRAEFRRRAFHVVADKTAIQFASLGGSAGYIGAAGIARSAYYKQSGARAAGS